MPQLIPVSFRLRLAQLMSPLTLLRPEQTLQHKIDVVEPQPVPLGRLYHLCESLPMPSGGKWLCWGHNYGGVLALNVQYHLQGIGPPSPSVGLAVWRLQAHRKDLSKPAKGR